MKQFFAAALLLSCSSLSASASSFEFVDNMITGPKGKSSIITLGESVQCADAACVDATGGNPNMNTASAQTQISMATAPIKKINFDFARKYPDPANPVPSASSESDSSAPMAAPSAPADSGTIAAQPPVASQPEMVSADGAASVPPANGTLPDGSRGTIDPNAPVMPIANSEMRESE